MGACLHLCGKELYPEVFRRLPGDIMTVCPIAIVAGCKRCPAFSICPLKTVLGDAPKPGEKPDGQAPVEKK
ncbi:hypothetical protein [Accumulibacter sp.]|uniref:hypothetical protein n=1 Tax=Accumulibacter sp. TaxID=2053492 RepID=UPI0025DC31BB|nr:hypothetical protein [Accumulibacter sp.]MCM8614037.1 hypothetical protein [Accumulibacter sp.]MCM8637810.1 hypothetical protein [Accumulibacter sp.]MCM8641213.1 hypothetical protein [Accumulibacter sp.]